MRQSRIVSLLLFVLLVGPLAGCRSAPSVEPKRANAMGGGGITKTLVQFAARQAVKYGDDALRAQQLAAQARRLNQLDEMLAQQRRAAEAARLAQEAARKATSLQQELDDLARSQVLDDVLRAQKAADEAQAIAASINRLRLVFYKGKIDEIRTRILDDVPSDYRDAAKEIVTEVFCDVLGQRLAGPLPERQTVEFNVRIRAILAGHDPDLYSEIAAESIRAEADYLAASLQWQEEAEGYKDACEGLLDLP